MATLAVHSSCVPAGQIAVSRIEKMPNLPQPYLMRDWKKVARDYDEIVYDFNLTGDYLPLIWWNRLRHNFPQDIQGIYAYVGSTNQQPGTASHAGNNTMASVVGASLVGIDKSNQDGHNFVLTQSSYFSIDRGYQVFYNSTRGGPSQSFWYQIINHILFGQLIWLYPDVAEIEITGNDGKIYTMNDLMRISAERWYEASLILGGSTSTPDYTIYGFDFEQMTASEAQPHKEPGAAAGVGWLGYMAYQKFNDSRFLQMAQGVMDFFEQLEFWENPYYETVFPHAVLLAARMNAERGSQYDVEKFLNWCFGPALWRPGFGVIADRWGSVQVDGLVGSLTNREGYVFSQNTFDMAGALAPVPRYDDRFARAIGKWLLQVANNSRLFYSNAHDAEHQSSEFWSDVYDVNSAIPYEGLRKLGVTDDTSAISEYEHVESIVAGIPAHAADVQIRLVPGAQENTGTLWVDNIEVWANTDYDLEGEISFWPNGGLEEGSGDLPTHWSRGGANGSSILFWDTDAASGVHALKVWDHDTGANPQWVSNRIALPEAFPGGWLTIAFDWKYDILANGPSGSWRVEVQVRDQDDNIVQSHRIHPGESGLSPYAQGDPLILGTANTDFALYCGSRVGYLAALIEPTDIEGIIQIDCLATDFFHAEAYPSFLYFNPYDETRNVEINVGPAPVHLYDTVKNRFAALNVRDLCDFSVDPDAACLLVLVPATSKLTMTNDSLYADGVVVDYDATGFDFGIANWSTF